MKEINVSSSKISIDDILQNPKIFKQNIANIWDLSDKAKEFPAHADALLRFLGEDREVFKEYIGNVHVLEIIATEFPVSSDFLFQHVLGDDDIFKYYIKYGYELGVMAKTFPDHANDLLERVLINPEIFAGNFQDVVRAFPDRTDFLFDYLFQHAEVLERSIDCISDLQRMADAFPKATEKSFPGDADIFLQYALKDSEMLNKCIKLPFHFREMVKTFPGHTDAILKNVLKNPEIFKKCIMFPSDLKEMVEAFPDQTDAILNSLLENPEIFNKFILCRSSLDDTVKVFPNNSEAMLKCLFENSFIFNYHMNNDKQLKLMIKSFPKYSGYTESGVEKVLEDLKIEASTVISQKKSDGCPGAINKSVSGQSSPSNVDSYCDVPAPASAATTNEQGRNPVKGEPSCRERIAEKKIRLELLRKSTAKMRIQLEQRTAERDSSHSEGPQEPLSFKAK